ncbi:MAG: aromatic amino acid lyase [Methylobacteriaceae bacterium]|nr:aromatic amino acid lyase [Methylobacteriaceae bacterium]
MPDAIEIDGRQLTLDKVERIALGTSVRLSAEARARIAASQAHLEGMMAAGAAIYGVTTGFGALDGAPVAAEKNQAQQRNLLLSHAAGVGPAMGEPAVRAMMALRLNVLASGQTGVRLSTADALLVALNAGLVPYVPRQGSVGACGDLAPLAHMSLPLIGRGKARIAAGGWIEGAKALEQAGLAPIELSGRDGIACINGTEQTTAIAGLALAQACGLIAAAEAVSVLTLEALGALDDSFDRRVAEAKPHRGQLDASAALRRLSAGSASISAPRPGRLRDALSLRCIPQVLGAGRDAVAHAIATFEIEINSVNDNPIFSREGDWITSNSGNFHGQAMAEVCDYAANALTTLAVISERRCARLIDHHLNGGLPAFLIHPDAAPGENSGFMIAQYTAAALVAELRQRSVPGSIQSVPTCANTEDHVPMAPLSARRLEFVVATAWQAHAIELLLAAQALDLRGVPAAPALRPLVAALRLQVPMMVDDRLMADDIEEAEKCLRTAVCGPTASLPRVAWQRR